MELNLEKKEEDNKIIKDIKEEEDNPFSFQLVLLKDWYYHNKKCRMDFTNTNTYNLTAPESSVLWKNIIQKNE